MKPIDFHSRSPRDPSRRRFLGQASCAAVGTASVFSSILNLRMMGTVAAAELPEADDYRALVCVFLAGGNDSFNMLTPVDDAGHAEYMAARVEVGLAKEAFTAIQPLLPDGRQLGIRNEMPELISLYQAGNAAFIANVGSLVEPVTRLEYEARSARLPLGLFSHSDQQMHWQSGLPDTRSPKSGWGGRISDLLESSNDAGPCSMNVSVAGVNLFQSGTATTALTIQPSGIGQLTSWNSSNFLARKEAMESLMDAEYRNVFERSFASMKRQAVDAAGFFEDALTSAGPLESVFSGGSLSSQLQAVARTIKARRELGKRRQTFFVLSGGWDLHSSHLPHGGLLASVSKAIGEFQTAMNELGVADEVTLFSASDFARTLTPNSGGTDHAWGGNHFVVGGAVRGGKVVGKYPVLNPGSALEAGRGRLIPSTSVDQYFAELALWMGVSRGNLAQVLPNLPRFADPMSTAPPLGFLLDD